jgi:hypothetical protein
MVTQRDFSGVDSAGTSNFKRGTADETPSATLRESNSRYFYVPDTRHKDTLFPLKAQNTFRR